MVGGGPFSWRAGEPTDDTGLTVAVAYAHLDGGNVRRQAWNRMLDWYDGILLGGGLPKDVGGATSRALNGRPDPAALGNGALMRCAPTALIDPAGWRQELAGEIARLTHPHPRSVACCVAYNEIAAALIAGASVDEAVQAGIDAADRASCPEVGDAIYWADRTAGDPAKAASYLTDSGRGYVLDSLILAVAAVSGGRPFDEALVWVIRHGHDTDTNAAIAGGLLGARHGMSAIPQRWLDRLEWGAWLADAADRIH